MEAKTIEKYVKENYKTKSAVLMKRIKTNKRDLIYMVGILVEEPKTHIQIIYVDPKDVEEWLNGKK